ncbi:MULTISPECIES: hypothetical protein [unclassified Burkholderia]|uniref:hypothetical protein n=1 Tax=unclassified Burkholderia TaxID=2613784 RepID=UPI001424384A|nr:MULTISPECIES: hypothetical protein [unclassified Burkholderia]NIE57326.1 hypothetical protein [Burkholderia sp. Ap-955]NIF08052.1 hypothetical protein [Burkholderia sp. Ax-1735]NIG02056.1 hypothetical protein [Burkholderia sp. Tr-849]
MSAPRDPAHRASNVRRRNRWEPAHPFLIWNDRNGARHLEGQAAVFADATLSLPINEANF